MKHMRLLTVAAGTLKLSGSSSSLTKMESRGRSSSMQSVDSVSHVYGSESDLAARSLFDQVMYILFGTGRNTYFK